MLQPGYLLDGKYEIQREVGRGGMSIVYLALDVRLKKLWAVKEVKATGKDPNGEIYISQFMQEAKMLMRLDHPALPRIVDLIDENGKKYVVMDFVEGQNLFEVIKEHGPFPEDEVIEWAKQITDALGYLHRQNPPIIYRDMKPGNVMLKPDGNIKIIDFGIAREYKIGNLTDTVALGTRGYIPPEQYTGQTDPRSDIFAVGMTMHNLLTGVDPRTADAYAPVRSWNPNLSEGIELIINKCVAPAPENRYQNCDELLYDLAHPEQITRDYKKKQKSKLRTFIAAALAGVIFLAGGVGMQVSANAMDERDFGSKMEDIEHGTSSLDIKFQLAQEAIKIHNNDPKVLQALLNQFWGNTSFDATYADKFAKLYDQCSFKNMPTDEAAFNLNLSVAEMYMVNSDNDTTRTQAIDALQYLSKNQAVIDSPETENYKKRDISSDFYVVLDYFTRYVEQGAKAAADDPSQSAAITELNKKVSVEDFFNACEGIVNRMENQPASDSGNSEDTEGSGSDRTAKENLILCSTIMKVLRQMSGEDNNVTKSRLNQIISLSDRITKYVKTEQAEKDGKTETVPVQFMDEYLTNGSRWYKLAEQILKAHDKVELARAKLGGNQ